MPHDPDLPLLGVFSPSKIQKEIFHGIRDNKDQRKRKISSVSEQHEKTFVPFDSFTIPVGILQGSL